MARVCIAFERWLAGSTWEEAKKKLFGYQEVRCHMIFDVKMNGLARKARLVARGHTTDTPSSITYSSVASRDSVRIAFLVAPLNDLDVMSADIGHAYLNAPNKEKTWAVAGPEFGTEQGAVFIITHVLYGLKSTGAAGRSFFTQALTQLHFRLTRGDGDIYIKPQTKPNGMKYYGMLLVYVDDILVLSHNTKPILDGIAAQFRLKEDSLHMLDQYLGAMIKIFTDCEGSESWAMSSDEYDRVVVNEVVEGLDKHGLKLKGKAFRPFDSDYNLELDVTEELDDAGVAKFQGYIGTFCWMIELRRLDILTEVSQLSSFQAMPQKGHLEACYSIFAYLRKHLNMAIIFHPSRMTTKESHFQSQETQRSQTGYIIFCNQSPILWYSKCQNTVEASTFSAEFIVARMCLEAIEALHFKLHMFGIPIEGPADVLCDINGVVNNTQKPDSVLSKMHLSICYHHVREAVACLVAHVGKIESSHNLADLFTKCLLTSTRHYLLGGMVHMGTTGLRTVAKNDSRLNCAFECPG